LPKTKKPDVFDNPSADLLIANIPTTNPSHILVLNKYPIIADHFIIVTKAYKPQAHLLERDDLEATYACLKAWQDAGAESNQKRLFAFFNSGAHSGASQPRRHLQFLPVENMRDDQKSNGWDLLMDLILESSKLTVKGMPQTVNLAYNTAEANAGAPSGLLQHPDVPFTHFALPLPAEPTGYQLEAAYNELYQNAQDAVENYVASSSATFALHSTADGSLPISYNLALTTSGMAILPRRNEGGMLRRDDGTDVGFVALNGTTLGGTLMVKHQEEWDVLRKQPGKLDSILEAIGIPKAR
jgi:ATP adenylyltransferase